MSSSDTDCTDSGEAKSTEPTTDCDDTLATRYPGNTEITGDGVDQDCDLKEICFIDVDNDGYYLSSGTVTSSDTDCSDSGEGSTADVTGDCNDGSASINPGATEITGDEVDQNCNNTETCFLDDDNDGYRPNSTSTKSSTDTDCQDTDEATASDPTGDCNDSSSTINPGATETIGDGTDQTCDGLETCYKDSDNDGYRPDSSSTVASSDSDCSDSGEALSSRPTGDCNDSSSSVNPGLPEICDAANTDEDCNGSADDADSGVASTGKTTYYLDADSDTYGVTGSTVSTCDPSGSYSATDGGDCDDAASSVNPGITSDTCWNGVDEDCDVAVDEGRVGANCYIAPYGELLISELFIYGDAGTDPQAEWFEVYNPHTTRTVYMESMTIVRSHTADPDSSFTINEVIAVSPQDTVVFCNVDTYLGALCDFEYGALAGTGFLLTQNSNTTLTIETMAADVASRTLDTVNYNGSLGGGSAGAWPGVTRGYSYELDPDFLTATNNDDGANWCETTGSAYYTSGAKSDYGTPNAANTCP
ncbi:putative metal-binding motif-containing protein [Myxococcota bacterium]|nr:putative metal-binding motif-containing protein [Myxococcota bacterium]